MTCMFECYRQCYLNMNDTGKIKRVINKKSGNQGIENKARIILISYMYNIQYTFWYLVLSDKKAVVAWLLDHSFCGLTMMILRAQINSQIRWPFIIRLPHIYSVSAIVFECCLPCHIYYTFDEWPIFSLKHAMESSARDTAGENKNTLTLSNIQIWILMTITMTRQSTQRNVCDCVTVYVCFNAAIQSVWCI